MRSLWPAGEYELGTTCERSVISDVVRKALLAAGLHSQPACYCREADQPVGLVRLPVPRQ